MSHCPPPPSSLFANIPARPSPAPLFFRVATKDTVVGGYTVKSGSAVVMSAAQLGKDPEYWGGTAPSHFDPHRGPPSHPFAYLPFGAGTRVCLGSRTAMAQVPAIVAAVAECASSQVKNYPPNT